MVARVWPAPVIAKAAKEKGILTVAVVTKPFDFEGKKRMEVAENSLSLLKENVDTLIVIPNQNLLKLLMKKLPFQKHLRWLMMFCIKVFVE